MSFENVFPYRANGLPAVVAERTLTPWANERMHLLAEHRLLGKMVSDMKAERFDRKRIEFAMEGCPPWTSVELVCSFPMFRPNRNNFHACDRNKE
jgi:hypothetical protein